MIHLYSGDGKGKTSIAVGMSVRMAGAGGKVIFAQFMKGNESSELNVLRRLPQVKVLKADKNFGFYNEMTEEDKAEITGLHNEILKEIIECVEQYRREASDTAKMNVSSQITAQEGELVKDNFRPGMLIVLDEITYPCRWHLIDEDMFKNFLKKLPEGVELVMTGRDPLDYMIELSDYWSLVNMKRHPFEKGVPARRGVEF